MPPSPGMNLADFAVLTRSAGFALTESQLAELHAAYGLLEQMMARVRQPRPMEAEPAHVFVAAPARRA
jgi:hypothetical protein